MKTHHMFIMLQLIFLFSLLMSGNGADVGVNEISRNIDAVGEESLSDPVTLHEVMMHCFEENMIERTSPRDISSVVYVNDIEDPVVTVDNWIDEIDAYNILLLASCVKHLTPEKHEYRPFDLDGYGGGNNVTYLNEIVQSVYPEVLDQILDVAASITDQVGWRPHPFHLGIRCLELLEYGPGGELRWHDDEDSIYTLSIMLTDHKDFVGGGFRIDRSRSTGSKTKDVMEVFPNQFGGTLFDSMAPHGVAPLTSGFRTVFVIELWPLEDSSFDDFRPAFEKKMSHPKIPKLIRVTPAGDIYAHQENEVISEDISLEEL